MYLLTMRQANGDITKVASSNYSLLVQEYNETPNVVWSEIVKVR